MLEGGIVEALSVCTIRYCNAAHPWRNITHLLESSASLLANKRRDPARQTKVGDEAGGITTHTQNLTMGSRAGRDLVTEYHGRP